MRQVRIQKRSRLTVALVAVMAASALLSVQLPANAHHKEGHDTGGPSPSPTPTPTPTPTASPTPATGDDPASPCATSGPATGGNELRCTAVSDDGSLEIWGAVAIEPTWSGGEWVSLTPDSIATFYVGIDTGAGFQKICSSSTILIAGSCGGTVAVPTGVPVECVIMVWSWSRAWAVAEVSCF